MTSVNCRALCLFVVAMWAEIDIKDKALMRVWHDAYGPSGFKKKQQ